MSRMATSVSAEQPYGTSVAVSGAGPWWRDQARMTILGQLAITGGPLVVGSIFPIGVPVYATLFGPLGKYNCLSHLVTGYPCPACGLTSSVVSTLHGRPDLALAYHPLGLAFVLLFVFGFLGGVVKWYGLTRTIPDHAFWRWLLVFPPHSWLNWLALGFLALYVGRACFWVSAGLA